MNVLNSQHKRKPTISLLVKTPLTIGIWTVFGVVLFLWVPWASNPDAVPNLAIAQWISDGMNYLIEDLSLFGVPFRDMTRFVAAIIDVPGDFLRNVLAKGFAFDWGSNYIELEPMSWIGLVVSLAMTSYWIGGRNLGLFGAFVGVYLLVFDLWTPSAETVASIFLAVPLSVVVGLLVGILGYRVNGVKVAITPILDLMQTMPIFAYMVPVLMLFGFGPASAIVATMIFAIPPMVRATMAGLERVPSEVLDLGIMVGASQRTQIWRILVPSAQPMIMVGVNQVIMNTLNMVIVASMIGAGGLGFEVLDSLRKLRIGQGMEAGIAITLLAILLDRLSQKLSERTHRFTPIPRTYWFMLAGLALVTSVLGQFNAGIAQFPRAWTISSEPIWSAVMTWLNVNAFDTLEVIKFFLLTNFLFPVRDLLQALPWGFVFAVSVWAGWLLGGLRLAILIAALETFILVSGLWSLAMLTLYLCGMGVLFAFLTGLIIAVLTFRKDYARSTALFLADLLQTLPSFVYLIPVVMLFRVGDFAAIVAVAAYAVAPAIRYTIHGLVGVPLALREVAFVSGCTRGQQLLKVEIPMAIPELLLGLNQTIMMGLAMVVITALVGTNDLGQETYIALARVDPGRGIVAGLGVAFIAMILDRILMAAAHEYKRKAIG